jgi:hypothetical protein
MVQWQWTMPPTGFAAGPAVLATVAPLTDTNLDQRIDARDVPAVIVHTTSGGSDGTIRLTALRGDTGAIIFDVARPAGVSFPQAYSGPSLAVGDLDGDGDLDIVTNNYGDVPQVFVSDLAQRGAVHALTVQLVGSRSNRDGIGAVVTLEAGGRRQVQVNDGKSGYLAQSVLPLYFGLGAATKADSITVKWPSGRTQVVRTGLEAGSKVVLRE